MARRRLAPRPGSLGCSVCLASPKSRSFAWPRSVTKMFAGLMSRWTIPLAWAASERIRDLRAQLQHPLRLHRLAADQVLQGLALHQLHHDEGMTLVLRDLVDHADVGVVEGGGGTGLALEALKAPGVAASSSGSSFMATCRPRRVSSASYTTPIPPAAELAEDPVVGQGLADHDRSRLQGVPRRGHSRAEVFLGAGKRYVATASTRPASSATVLAIRVMRTCSDSAALPRATRKTSARTTVLTTAWMPSR